MESELNLQTFVAAISKVIDDHLQAGIPPYVMQGLLLDMSVQLTLQRLQSLQQEQEQQQDETPPPITLPFQKSE